MTDRIPADEVPGPVADGTPEYQHPPWDRKTEICRWGILSYLDAKDVEMVRAKYVKDHVGWNTRKIGRLMGVLEDHDALVRWNENDDRSNGRMYKACDPLWAVRTGQLVADRHPGSNDGSSPITIVRRASHSAGEYVIPQVGMTVEQFHRDEKPDGYDCSKNEMVVEAVYGEFEPETIGLNYNQWQRGNHIFAFPEGRLKPAPAEILRSYDL